MVAENCRNCALLAILSKYSEQKNLLCAWKTLRYSDRSWRWRRNAARHGNGGDDDDDDDDGGGGEEEEEQDDDGGGGGRKGCETLSQGGRVRGGSRWRYWMSCPAASPSLS